MYRILKSGVAEKETGNKMKILKCKVRGKQFVRAEIEGIRS